ncbi:YlbF family regulator [Bacillus sp. CECT 9360]|uniref:YlbF family regulator n=1 Tax=Bacillus sp. CECT 9360 TaxID=2845821 RepID=UPI001E5F5500|nr:YlbF family regulator [Bacillus sp. CECT 9360]CAH0344360.1 hypothetical protein BCI9360_00610 [Bacillus sp. CECT 9360]
MSANLYDSAYDMERAIRGSKEYTELKNQYDQVNADPSARSMFENFRQIQMTLQEKQMTGQEITPEEVEQAQKTVALVQQHPTISKLMEAEQRLSMVIAELNKIIMKPLEDLYGLPEQE